ncbi:hypothetical protein EXIGLDRAFT_616384 [Exidia glandulosa HHB12029]|uniref:Uncharacterized protein n=1 Tax=Exidia glandulosa HHB12029 TaxID=1314781 RepID=A0A165GQ31_EXIGL|nr:hypothetical protein EXIGLDRAFT_616384 [Exidia glandulosa HHB12029]
MQDFTRRFGSSIKDFNFRPGDLVLVRNTRIEKDLGRKKTDDRYYGPMLVVERHAGGSYVVAELDGAVSMLHCAAFRLFPYFPRIHQPLDVSDILDTSRSQLSLLRRTATPIDNSTAAVLQDQDADS